MFYAFYIYCIFIMLLTFFINKKDILSPSFLVAFSFFVSSSFCVFNYELWDLESFSWKTATILIIGLTIFTFNDIVSKHLNAERINSVYRNIYIKKWKTMMVIFFLLIVLFFTIKQVNQIGNIGNGDSALYNYRIQVSYRNEATNSVLNLLTEIAFALSCLYTYIFVVNIRDNRRLDSILNLIPILLFLIIGISSGSRFNIIKILCAGLIYFSFYHLNRKMNTKELINFSIILLFFLFVFYEIRNLTGRSDDSDMFTYLSGYVGGAIKLFDMFIQSDYIKNDIIGQESLYSINKILIKLGIINYPQYASHLEFRFVNGINLGNVYTGFRRVINDYGVYFGMMIICLISLFYSIYYKMLKLKFDIKNKLNYPLLYYGMIVYVLITFSINDSFTMAIISINFIELMIYTFILSKVLFTVKLGDE